VVVLAAVQLALIVRTVRARRMQRRGPRGDVPIEGDFTELLWVALPGVLLGLLLVYSVLTTR
jgi:heme/copper-type cytochrome/quinol oxidase subunit 2